VGLVGRVGPVGKTHAVFCPLPYPPLTLPTYNVQPYQPYPTSSATLPALPDLPGPRIIVTDEP